MHSKDLMCNIVGIKSMRAGQHAIDKYEKFLNLWKNADEEVPELSDAIKRLAKLEREVK